MFRETVLQALAAILRNAMRARVPPADAGCLDANASR